MFDKQCRLKTDAVSQVNLYKYLGLNRYTILKDIFSGKCAVNGV